MGYHPSGIKVDAVGIDTSTGGSSCEKHQVCGSVLELDSVVHFKVVELEHKPDEANPELEATAIAVHHVSGGINCCRVGFLRRHLLKYKEVYDARLAQIIDIYSDESESPSDWAKHHRNKVCSEAVLIEAEYRKSTSPPSKEKKG